ncbi:hypothetical protein NMD99_02040 [Wolbachia endosymbiont of Listronotus oregonensis]|uniref:hypothetical protein n=1 Tax=Wolbachia endosymbiont of Listronotus oregonensis TaxID=2969106 RepID=UPI002815F267|nr:hypothetical protein [Wolbachia endosymbiont of Listronotus oregonensis]WMT84796.1 hypothetical protein NMD99_02040 [Wolbachia endosymbiont of Listronotus oregonensis]
MTNYYTAANRHTATNRHTAAVSLDPANKQRDDGCRLAINIKEFTKQKKGKRSPSHCLFSVFGVF